MANPTEGQPRIRVEILLDPDGINGDTEVLVSGDDANVRVIIYRGPEGEVVYDTDPDPEGEDEDEDR